MTEKGYEYQVWDTCEGTVEAKDSHGVYLILDNGEPAYAYSHLNLRSGDRVFCSVKRKAGQNRRKLVSIDSTLMFNAA